MSFEIEFHSINILFEGHILKTVALKNEKYIIRRNI